MKHKDNEYESEQISIDDAVSQFWCQVIEGIVRDTIQKTMRSMRVEQYAEVEIIGANAKTNTVNCRNIQTGEILRNVPNYSNIYISSVLTDNMDKFIGVVTSTGEEHKHLRGRIFMTNINDNPYYLGVWYN